VSWSETFDAPTPWVVDFWRSQLANDDPRIQSLTSVNHRALYQGALQGVVTNASVTHLLCHFDYLRDSRNPAERATGQALYALAEKIIRFSLLDGELVDIERIDLHPEGAPGRARRPAREHQQRQRLPRAADDLPPRAHVLPPHAARERPCHAARGARPAAHRRGGESPASGLAEALPPGVRDIFPNLQIIAATHSPFVLASVPDARVYVCQYDPATRRTTISEETAAYQNKPVDEILSMSAFDGTGPFGEEITELLERAASPSLRRTTAQRREVEQRLMALNPTYFGYLDLDRQIEALRTGELMVPLAATRPRPSFSREGRHVGRRVPGGSADRPVEAS
jgi:hypothetical protein